MVQIKDYGILFESEKFTASRLGAVHVKNSTYKLPKTIDAVRDLYVLTHDPELLALGQQMKKAQDRLIKPKLREDAPELKEKFPELRPYQRVDISFLKQLPHALVGNEQRTGKSPTALSLFEEEGRKKNCIVCPASLIINWAKEVKAWTDKTPYPVIGTPKKKKEVYEAFRRTEEGYLIVSYETLRKDVGIIETL